MRTVTGPETTVLQGAHYATYARVLVEDADGTYQDLTNQDSIDWVQSGRLAQTIDQIVATGTFTFWRKQEGGNSLAPLDEDSLLNRNAASAYAPLIDAGRGIRCEFATVTIGSSPSGADWKRVFQGVIDQWTVEDDFVQVMARDAIGAEIADRWIETETTYGTGPGRAMEDVIQDILTAWTGLTLFTPTSPSFLITTYIQQRSTVMDALQQIAALIGWVVQPRWDDGTSSFRLTLQDPDRAPVSTDWTWAANRYEAVPDFTLSRLDIRNALSLWYTNTSDVRTQVTASDATSITNYDRQWMEIEEPKDSPIDTTTEAQDMLDKALLDLKDPVANQEIKTLCFWPIQLNDYYLFTANDVHYSEDQSFGVTGFRHEFGGGQVDTFIRTRGVPAGFVRVWLQRAIGDSPREEILTFRQASAPTARSVGDLWYDTDDGNKLYRWDGVAWISVRDTTIATAQSAADGAQATADGRNTMFRQATAPTANATGDLWFDSDDGDHIYRWDGAAWVSVLPDIDAADLIGNIDLDTQVSGTLATAFAESGLVNTSVTINADGMLSGAGGGQANINSLPGTVSAGQIEANAVTAVKIQAGAVIAGKIAALSIVAGDIAANTITGAKIAANTITATEIAANTITATEIAASTITASEMNVATLSAISANLGTVMAGTLNASVIVSARSFTAATATFTGNVRVDGTITIDGAQFIGAKFSIHDDTNGTTIVVQNSSGSPQGVQYDFSGASPNNKSAFFVKLQDSSAVRARIWSDGSFDGKDGLFSNDVTVTGNLGVGVLHATKRLNVQGAVSAEFFAALINTSTGTPQGLQINYSALAPDNTTRKFLYCHDSVAARMEVRSDGDVWTSDAGILTSDRTTKENIVDATPKLDDVLSLRIVNFNWNTLLHPPGENQTRKRIGYIGQEAELIFPGLVGEGEVIPAVRDDEGTVITPAVRKKELRAGAIGAPILVKAFQESVAEYRSEIALLKDRVALLEAA